MSTDYVSFFLNSASRVVELETFEILHPNMLETRSIVRNNSQGMTANIEGGILRVFTYDPAKITRPSEEDDLDQGFDILVGDTGDVLGDELDRIAEAGGFDVKPQVIYRTFRSDDLSAPMTGPFYLELPEISMAAEGASFQARPPTLNQTRTGEIYTIARFPMLRGVL